MRYLLTEHGSVLKYDEEKKELSLLEQANQWRLLVGYTTDLLEYSPLVPPHEETTSIVVFKNGLGTVKSPTGSLNSVCEFHHIHVDGKAWEIDESQFQELWNSLELRVKAGIEIKKAAAQTQMLTTTLSDSDLYQKSLKQVNSTSYNYSKLSQFAEAERKRLKRPFTMKAKEKLQKLDAAITEIKAVQARWNASEQSQAQLENNAYVQIAHQSGLISALNTHRFSWTRAAKRGEPTKAMKKLEQECPGISKAI